MVLRRLIVLGALAGVLACSRTAVGPVEHVRSFGPGDTPISMSGVSADDGGWRVEHSGAGSVPLFELAQQHLENTTLTYRAHMRSSDLAGNVYVEMWVRVPGRGEFFSRGLEQPIRGTSGWASYE